MEKVFIGVTFILYGLFVIMDPTQENPISGLAFDFTGLEIPFGILCIVFGAAFLWLFYRDKRKLNNDAD